MKRWLIAFTVLSLLLLIILPACGGDEDEEKPTTSPTITATPITSPTATVEPTATPSPISTPMPFTTIVAEPWLKITDDIKFIPMGLAFDREGNLYFVNHSGVGKVFKVTMADKKITTIYDGGRGYFSSIDIHKDGRLFLCDFIFGKIIAMNPDGTGVTEILTSYNGEKTHPCEMIFDNKGNFYFTDLQGSLANPTGRVFRVSSNLETIDLVADGLAQPNGISLAPDESRLWIGESGRHALTELNLGDDGITLSSDVKIVYQFTGSGSSEYNAVDEEGNIYQCLIGEGKIVVFNKNGVPVAEILTPGRDEGKQLSPSCLAFQPGTDKVFMTVSGKDGVDILTFSGLAKGLSLFSHQ